MDFALRLMGMSPLIRTDKAEQRFSHFGRLCIGASSLRLLKLGVAFVELQDHPYGAI